MDVQFGSFLRLQAHKRILDDKVLVERYELDTSDACVTAAALAIAAAHVSPEQQRLHPGASVRNMLAARTSTRRGDFGEVIARLLYAQRLGYDAPFEKLRTKPTRNATQQGADVLALTIDPDASPRPVLVEVKTRVEVSPKEDLGEISAGLSRADPEYLADAWRTGVQALDAHPDRTREFAYTAAVALARLDDNRDLSPDHAKHAVIVTSQPTLNLKLVEKYWTGVPPVTTLRLVTVPGLVGFIDAVYDHAAGLKYRDLAPGLDNTDLATKVGGLRAPVVSPVVGAAGCSLAEFRDSDERRLIEACWWFLADWDGIGNALARLIATSTDDPDIRALAQLLTGRVDRHADESDALASVLDAAAVAWRTGEVDQFRRGVTDAVGLAADPGRRMIALVGAVIGYRLDRHPARVVAAAGALGLRMRWLLKRLSDADIRALWPSQAAAISAGLLDPGQPSIAMRMPTSAGKTLLIALTVAQTLDRHPGSTAIVLAPRQALVNQIQRELHRLLRPARVAAVHGGMDRDLDDGTNPFEEYDVVVMTPERFDLEWRRATVDDDASDSLDQIRLLAVDEADLIGASQRGPRLELSIARALQRNVRVVLVSSQFGNLADIASWIGGATVDSDWTPTWLHREAYYYDPADAHGTLLQDGTSAARLVPNIVRRPADGPYSQVCATGTKKADQAAGLAAIAEPDGLVVVYSGKKSYINSLAERLSIRLSPVAGRAFPKATDAIRRLDPFHAQMMELGIGIHHADVPRALKLRVETAAKAGQLRCIVCTATLLEGIDLPTRTVIVAYPHSGQNVTLTSGSLRNLAGRAGRGGRHTSGRFIVMAADKAKASQYLKTFRAALTPTRSALEAAFIYLRRHATDIGTEQLDSADLFVLTAIAEAAVVDGELRRHLESLLNRTLWWAGQADANRSAVLTAAQRRAAHVRPAVSGGWDRTFYKTGLSLRSNQQILEAIRNPSVSYTTAHLDQNEAAGSRLVQLLLNVAPSVWESHWPSSLDLASAGDAIALWIGGAPLARIHDVVEAKDWNRLEGILDRTLPWVTTAAVEIEARHHGFDEQTRAERYADLQIARLRYGVPDTLVGRWVRRGLDRERASQLLRQFRSEHAEDIDEFIGKRLTVEEREALELRSEFGEE